MSTLVLTTAPHLCAIRALYMTPQHTPGIISITYRSILASYGPIPEVVGMLGACHLTYLDSAEISHDHASRHLTRVRGLPGP
jgi:hypothetical protein